MIEIIESFSQLENIWNILLQNSNSNNPFLTFQWQKTYWRYFAGNKKLFIITIKNKEKIIAIFPLMITTNLGFKKIQFIGTSISDYLDFIIEKGKEEESIKIFILWLKENEKLWDLIDLQQIPSLSLNFSILKKILLENNLSFYDSLQEICPFISLPENYDEFKSFLSKRFSKNITYYSRLLQKSFKVDYDLISENSFLDERMDELFKLHQTRWQKEKLPGAFFSKKRKLFHKEIAREFLKENWLRLYTLSLDRKISAVLYGFVYNEKFYYYLSGFDYKLSKYSIGTLLTSFCIKEAILNKLKEFDFLRGGEEYKYKWTKDEKQNKCLQIFKKESKSKILLKIDNLQKRIESKVKKVVQKT